MNTQLIIGVAIVIALVGLVLFARHKIRSGGDGASGGGGRPGADKH